MRTIHAIKYFKMWMLLAIVFNINSAFAQLENIPIGKDVNIDKLYVGLLANTDFIEKKSDQGSNSSFQSGVRASIWLIPRTLLVRSFFALRLNENQETNYIKSYETIFSPSQDLQIAIGVMATPTTELRPNPITWQSQVETHAESKIPGGKPGMKVRYRFNKNLKMAYGIHNHDNQAVQHFNIVFKKITASSFLKDRKLFFAIRGQYKNSNFVMTHDENNTALSAIVQISVHYKLYSDMEYNYALRKLNVWELGLRKHFQDNKSLRGFLSISYNNTLKQFRGGLFIHI